MMHEKPEITVFMPVYNAEEYLKEAIESILHQTYKNFELLIVNDGSTDNSVKIINNFDDSRIVLVSNEKNMGLPYSRNRGLELARGKYLAIMDADDVSDVNRLKLQYEVMEKNPELVVVASGKELISETEHLTYGLKEKLYSYLFYRKPVQIQVDLMFHNILVNSSTMTRLDFIKKNNIQYNTECVVMQDYEFWTQICARQGKIQIIRKPLVKYRNHVNNISSRTRNNKIEMRRKIQQNIQTNYMKNLGFQMDSEMSKYIQEFGKEFEEQKENGTSNYLDELYLFYKRIINEVEKTNVFETGQVMRYLRQKYLLVALKSPKQKGRYVLKAMKLK